MAFYPRLAALLLKIQPPSSETALEKEVIPYLVDVWLEEYGSVTDRSEVVETTVDSFSYLFDIPSGRLIAAWGISRGRQGADRDKARMAGHPLSAGPRYHRGHAIPHRLGGGTDINLVAQLGRINIGPFRTLERQAIATPGALYFTYWMYGRSSGQTPTGVQQGLLAVGRAPLVRTFRN
jgi:hypothetical protein